MRFERTRHTLFVWLATAHLYMTKAYTTRKIYATFLKYIDLKKLYIRLNYMQEWF